MPLQIIFRCQTCEHINSMELGRPNFTPWKTEFESVTDMWRHLYDTHRDYHDSIHEIVPEIKEE